MTEIEVIEKLEFFKNAIINLKNELSEKEEFIEELSTPSSSLVEENLQSRIEELEAEVSKLKQKIEEQSKVSEQDEKSIEIHTNKILEQSKEIGSLKRKLSEEKENYVKLKKQAYNTIKHLVEDVIETKEKEFEEINNKTMELEKLLFEKGNKEHKMIVKSAEKELQEMISES